jgi:hypothetical protein
MTVIVALHHDHMRYELDLEIAPRRGLDRPFAWKNGMGGKVLIERSLGKLYLDGRQVRLHEVDTSATRWTKLRDAREALKERITPNEAVHQFLMEHRWLLPQDFRGRYLVFFGSGRQLDGDASVCCLSYNGQCLSTFDRRLSDEWTKDYAALYIDNAAEAVAS